MPIEPVDIPEDAKEQEPKPPRRKAGERMPGARKLRDQVADLYSTVGMMVVTPIDPLGGYLLAANSEDLADQWIALAETNPSVKRALQKLVEAGGWGGVIMAHGMILLPVLANRGLLPDQVAAGAAMATVAVHPDAAPHFNHERFQRMAAAANGEPGQERGPHVVQPDGPNGANGNG